MICSSRHHIGNKGIEKVRRYIARRKGLADRAGEHESQLPAFGFLILAHMFDDKFRGPMRLGNVFHRCWQADAFKVAGHAHNVLAGAQLKPMGQLECAQATESDGLTVQQFIGIAGFGFEGMGEGVAKIE